MYYKRFFKKVVPVVIVLTLVLAVLLISHQQSNKNQQMRISPVRSDSNTEQGNSKERIQGLSDNLQRIQQPNNESPLNDPYFNKLQNEDIQLASKQADTLARVPVIKWQNDLVAHIKNEDINQTIINISNFDDTIMAGSSLPQGHSPAVPDSQNLYVTRLARVRKLYAIGKENPQSIIPILKSVHKDSIAQWPSAVKEFGENYDKGIRSFSEPGAFDRCLDYCLAATYLLAELGDYDSLPLLTQQYKMHKPLKLPEQMAAPVPPATTFYAMHRLVSTYPRDKLSAEAVKALDEYLNAAKELVPPPKQLEVTVWDSYYVESDPRVTVLGVQDEILKSQKTMTMPLYPYKFKDGSDMETLLFVQTEKLNSLFNKLDAFVQIMYPSQGNPTR